MDAGPIACTVGCGFEFAQTASPRGKSVGIWVFHRLMSRPKKGALKVLSGARPFDPPFIIERQAWNTNILRHKRGSDGDTQRIRLHTRSTVMMIGPLICKGAAGSDEMDQSINNRTVTLVTLSFRGDFELCKILCESVDRFIEGDIKHVLVVPNADLALFAPLANSRRTLVAEDLYLPRWLIKFPLPSQKWRKRLGLPRRNIYLSLLGRPVRGWIAQQLMKLAVAASLETDVVLMVDSDVVFVRPFLRDAVFSGKKARLQRFQGAVAEMPAQVAWRSAANNILGLNDLEGGHVFWYIDNIVSWTPQNVRRLLKYIENYHGRHWLRVLASMPSFSEYILYGVFCDRWLGLENSGHFGIDTNLCYTIWSEGRSGLPIGSPEFASVLNSALSSEHVAIGIQSTVPLSLEMRRSLIFSIQLYDTARSSSAPYVVPD